MNKACLGFHNKSLRTFIDSSEVGGSGLGEVEVLHDEITDPDAPHNTSSNKQIPSFLRSLDDSTGSLEKEVVSLFPILSSVSSGLTDKIKLALDKSEDKKETELCEVANFIRKSISRVSDLTIVIRELKSSIEL